MAGLSLLDDPLLAQSPRTFSYTTQPGDTMESVTALFSMTEERFRELNPDLTLEPAAPTASRRKRTKGEVQSFFKGGTSFSAGDRF